MDNTKSEAAKGNFDFFYQNSGIDNDEVMSAPSSDDEEVEDELVEAINNHSAVEAAHSARGLQNSSPLKSVASRYSSYSQRPSRQEIASVQAKAALAKGFTGYDSFGSISLDYTTNCGCIALCCEFNKEGNQIATGLTNGMIKVFDSSSVDMNHLYTLSDDITNIPTQGVTAVRYLSSAATPNIVVGGYTSGHVKIWHLSTGKALTTFEEGRETLNIAVDPLASGSRLLSVGGTPEIFLYDMVSKKRVSTFKPSVELDRMDGHRSKVHACKFHPTDVNVFYTGGWDNTIQFWDTRRSKAVRSLFGPHICGDSIDLDVDHNHLITGSWRSNEVVQIWDYGSLNLIKTVVLPEKAKTQAYCCCWLGQQFILVAGSSGNMVACIDRSSLNVSALIRSLPGGVYSVSREPTNRPNGTRFAAVTDSFLLGLSVDI